MSHYYNEHDPFAAAWLRELINAGLIPAGDVDERDIREVQPDDVRGYTQAHFFAGIGGWPLALRLAGWPADRPVWTGSCPCQPFSVAGKRKGTNDDRHLWPEFFRLIRECHPPIVFGEQVAGKAGLQWLDGVFADLEGEDYSCGASDLCAASVDAPHIRQRLFWVSVAGSLRCGQGRGFGEWVEAPERCQPIVNLEPDGKPSGLSDALCERVRLSGRGADGDATCGVQAEDRERERVWSDAGAVHGSRPVGLRDASGEGLQERIRDGRVQPEAVVAPSGQAAVGRSDAGYWSRYEVLHYRDGKARRIEPGTFPLAHGIPGRVGRISAYGNAIVPQVAAEFVAAFLDVVSSAPHPPAARRAEHGEEA